MLTVALFSGCASATGLQWPGPTDLQESPPPIGRLQDRANSDLPEGRGRSGPRTPTVGTPGEGDLGLVRAAAETPSGGPAAISSSAVPPAQEYPIDLTTALRLAEVENPLIAEARQRIGAALAVQQGAMALLLPTLNAGMNYHAHTGNLQRSSGRILNLDEKSFYFGGGSEVYAASPAQIPAVNIFSELTDAIFEPLAARQQVVVARFGASATANNILLEVAERYFELLAAEADLRVRRESATQEAEVARLTRAYAQAQQGREADAERAATELSLIVDEIRQAEEEVAVASARLAHRLHLDQSVRVRPVAPGLEKVTIVDPETPLPALIQVALQRRPELAARVAALAAAEIRHKQECWRPLLPTLWLGYTGGAFGGGSNLVKPELGHFAGRTDFDVRAYWTFQNLGLGNLSRQKRRWAEVGLAVSERSRVIAEIRTEVSAAYAEVSAARQQIDITTRELASAEAGFREDLDRIRNTVGRPIEVVNSLQLLNQARVDRIRAVTDYNKAEFRLFVALGSPPPLGEAPDTPIPPAPIASPILPPLARGAARSTQ
jgi:outer membrane protein TolC